MRDSDSKRQLSNVSAEFVWARHDEDTTQIPSFSYLLPDTKMPTIAVDKARLFEALGQR